MTLDKFREDIVEYKLDYEFLRDCLEYIASFGILNDLYAELELNKYENIDELLERIESKQEVARAVYFGNIQSWNDDYFYLDDAGNINSENQYQYEKHYIDYKEDIMNKIVDFIDKEDLVDMENIEELIDFIKNCIL